jgi:hypothetical protein
MSRDEIGGLTRAYVFGVLANPRDNQGRAIFKADEEAAKGWEARRAVSMGMPRARAAAFADRRASKGQRKGG